MRSTRLWKRSLKEKKVSLACGVRDGAEYLSEDKSHSKAAGKAAPPIRRSFASSDYDLSSSWLDQGLIVPASCAALTFAQ